MYHASATVPGHDWSSIQNGPQFFFRGTSARGADGRHTSPPPPRAMDRWRHTPRGASRAEQWPRACGASTSRREFTGHFHALVELRSDETHALEVCAQIEKDLPRVGGAFDGLDLTPGGVAWNALRRVLLAFASHAPEVGYVQSMHSIAAFLLLAGVDEEDAFWCLVTLVQEVVPGYFSSGMLGAKLDQRVFSQLLRERLPAVGLHVAALAADDIIAAIMSSQWLLTLFVNVLPTRVTMELWDEVFSCVHRAPLFAACIALLEPNAEDILATTEMGEAIELLQKLGDTLQTTDGEDDDAKCDAFISRVRELIAKDLSPARVDGLTARVRGKQRRPSDIRLPKAITDVAAYTDVDDLYIGLVSRDLQQKMAHLNDGAAAGAHEEKTSLRSEIAALKAAPLEDDRASPPRASMNDGDAPRPSASENEPPSAPPPSSGLTADDVDSIAAQIVALEAHARTLPEHGSDVLALVKHTVLRPLRAIIESRLKPFREEIVFLDREFSMKTQRLRRVIDENSDGVSDLSQLVLRSQAYTKSVWPLWSESLFEDTVEQAEITLESLEQIRAELSWMVSVFVGEKKKEIAPKIPRAEGWEDIAAVNLMDAITPEPDAECLNASVQSHKNETENKLSEIRAAVTKTHEDAVRDLPVLRKNLSTTTGKLKEELSSEEDAVNSWASAAEKRNASKQQSMEAKLRDASGGLLRAYDAKSLVVDASDDVSEENAVAGDVTTTLRTTSPRSELERSHAAEELRLQAVLQNMKNLEMMLNRRANALEREKQTAASVRAISERTLSQTNASLLLVFEAGEWLESQLTARSSLGFVDKFEDIVVLAEELSTHARMSCARILQEWALFVRKLTSQVVLEYVSIIDTSTQAISDVQGVLDGHLSRLDSASSVGSGSPTFSSARALDPSVASPPGSLRASFGGLTTHMEKLTDIAGSKLGTIGNRLRNMGVTTNASDAASLASPRAAGASTPQAPLTTSASKASKLAITCREDNERLENRRAQLLLKKTWLRQHVMERGDL